MHSTGELREAETETEPVTKHVNIMAFAADTRSRVEKVEHRLYPVHFRYIY